MSESGILREKGLGNVTAGANMADNKLVRGDGGAKGIQDSGITVDDSDNMSLVNTLSVVDGATTRTNLGLAIGSDVQAWGANLDGVSSLALTGLISRTGAGTFASRSIVGTTNFIDISDGDGIADNPTASIASNFQATGMHGWNGAIIESPVVTVTSNGAAITFSVEQSGGGDLTLVFSDGYTTFDSTPAATIALTEGTDKAPQINYVYILQSTKALTASTSAFPSSEHIPLASVLCQSAASLQNDGAYKVHAWTDHVTSSDDQGHISDINYWIRNQQATWKSGVGQTFTITTNGGAADNVLFTTVAGMVLQLHDHTFPAFSGTPDIYVVNDATTPYNKVTDLNELLTDSTGGSMSGRRFSLVIWGVVSEATGDCKLMVNLPSGTYGNNNALIRDNNKYANFTIPADFVGTGFLITQWNLRHQAAASGTWTSIEEVDLRGLLPAVQAGGSTASPSEFTDDVFRILDDGDNTKEIAFQASGIATGTTRTYTAPDVDGTLITSATPPTTKGDLIVSDGSDNIREAIGADDTVLTADSAQASGVKWAAAGGGGGGALGPFPNFDDGGTILNVTPFVNISALISFTAVGLRLYLSPIAIIQDCTLDYLGVQCALAVAGATVRLGLYDSVKGIPTNLKAESAELSLASTGIIESAALSTAITAGWYWMAMTVNRNSGSPAIKGSSLDTFTGIKKNGAVLDFGNGFYVSSVDPSLSLTDPISPTYAILNPIPVIYSIISIP